MSDDFDARVAALAALGEPLRRALYRYVAAQPGPVGRDQAAEGVGVPRHVAKFHLDRLAADGLLEVEFRRPPGRGGPGAGRPAKLYRRASREVRVSLPERRYDLAARLLAQAIVAAERDCVPVAAALRQAAAGSGHALGVQARRAEPAAGRAALPAAASAALQAHGYEPRADPDGSLILTNCPFDALARDHAELVCGMNLELIEGLLAGLGQPGLHARLDPAPGRCCVTVRQRPPARKEPP